MGIIGDWDAVYVQKDVSAYPQINDSVDTYAKKYGLKLDDATFVGGTHNPLYDSLVTARVYADYVERFSVVEKVIDTNALESDLESDLADTKVSKVLDDMIK